MQDDVTRDTTWGHPVDYHVGPLHRDTRGQGLTSAQQAELRVLCDEECQRKV